MNRPDMTTPAQRRHFTCADCTWEAAYPEPAPAVVFHSCAQNSPRRRLVDWFTQPSLEEKAERARTDWFTSKYPTPKAKE
jgi:hypothetical protein